MEQLEKLMSIYSQRDDVFASILSHYENKPTRIFQIGAIETLDQPLFRIGSGWSDIIFGKHVKQYGGLLTVVDISLDHLANSLLFSNHVGYDINLQHGDGAKYIDDSYDIYYLDGSIDPKETLDQFEKVLSFDKKNIYIVIDDFSIKGTMIDTKKFAFTIHNIEKGLGVFYYGE